MSGIKISNRDVRVSIILPTYNGGRFIERAIASVLNQTVRDFELLIIDDGSTDDTATRVDKAAKQDKRVRYLRNVSNLGIQKSLNRGLKEAKGEYVARIDDDDVWSSADKLARQLQFFDAHPDYVLVGTGIITVDEQDNELFRFLNPETNTQIRRRMLYRNCFSHSSVVYKKDVAMQVGGYDESEAARHIEDYDLWLKLGAHGKIANLPSYDVRFALRGQAISGKNKREQLKRQFALMERYKNVYPNYVSSRMKSATRLFIYTLFGWVLTPALRQAVLKVYKGR